MLKKISYPFLKGELYLNIEALNQRFDRICILDSNLSENKNQFIKTDQLLAVGTMDELIVSSGNALQQLQHFCDKHKENWLFGYLSYDLKNETEKLKSENHDRIKFPLLHFFVPEVVLHIELEIISVFYDERVVTPQRAESILNIATSPADAPSAAQASKTNTIVPKITKQQYLEAINKLKQHIHKGDIYEINFCQEFFAEDALINTTEVYQKLNAISRAPFAAYYKFNNHYLLCASPERFLKRESNHLISQPIKGTAKRSTVVEEDEHLKWELRDNEKEKSENVMIVDLVRNDLSRIAKRGTVNVDELFGIYSFKQVHQMISTISCELKEDISFTDILKSTFPMGSMTGAPKVSAMKLIEKFESTQRGLYSGAVGYIRPDGDFDFNVVIRSILYNGENNYLSFMVGSAITDKSIAENEYEECLLKAKAMFEVLK